MALIPFASFSVVKFRFYWPMLAVALLGSVFIFTSLGSDYLWEDEGDTATYAVNILKFGVPRAWDGVTFIDSDRGLPLNKDLVLISHPLLQYYLTAASFAVFGQSNWAARLPFAVAGWLTILIAYLCAYDLTKNRWAALCSATLLTTSVQFLLFCRQCRYYPLSMLLACLLVWIFFNMRSIRSALLFAIVGILLFHSHPFGIVFVGALSLVGVAYPSVPGQRRFLCWAGLVIALFTLPWIALVRFGYASESVPVSSAAQFGGRLIQYAIECASVTPLIGIAILTSIFAISWMSRARSAASRGQEEFPLDRRQLGLLLVTLVTVVCYAVALAITASSDDIWRAGIRYTTALMPLTALAAGVLIVNVSRGRIAIWLPLLLIFAFTKLAQLTPWIFWGEKQTTFDGKELVRAHLPLTYGARYLTTPELLAFFRDLKQENPGTLAKACQFLQGQANAGDLVLTNYDWQPLYFYTRLPQSLRIFPNDPIYETAKRKGLPEYVFNVDGVRWLIWRPVWGGYFGYVGSEIKRDLLNSGAQLTKVAEFPETIFENRPEIHYHRFSGDKYFFMALNPHVTAQIFRIDWPAPMLLPPADEKN
jgi:4-amino-4-deoxy-L-arabinose transferase-like glycosyltransferase